MSKLVHTNAILPFTAGEDLSNKVGFPVILDNGAVIAAKDATGTLPIGVLLVGGTEGEQVSVAMSCGLAGTVKVKLQAAVTEVGKTLSMATYGDDCAGAPVAAGERIEFAMALETGVADELVEAALFKPVYITA